MICMKDFNIMHDVIKKKCFILHNKFPIKFIGCGFGLGILTFAISYGIEMLILTLQGNNPHLSAYITNFGLTGATAEVSLSVGAVLICIGVNIINVLVEEGSFRGFILKKLFRINGDLKKQITISSVNIFHSKTLHLY